MKRMIALFLVFILTCSFCLACNKNEPTTTASTDNHQSTKPSPVHTEPPRETVETYSPYLKLGEGGKQRIEYTINLSNVRYITSVDQLPEHACFAKFDEQYFQTNALVVVTETVRSGSVNVQIESIQVVGEIAVVTLSHSSGGPGTGDMAVWFLWVEVEQGLSYQWQVANPAVGNGSSNS